MCVCSSGDQRLPLMMGTFHSCIACYLHSVCVSSFSFPSCTVDYSGTLSSVQLQVLRCLLCREKVAAWKQIASSSTACDDLWQSEKLNWWNILLPAADCPTKRDVMNRCTWSNRAEWLLLDSGFGSGWKRRFPVWCETFIQCCFMTLNWSQRDSVCRKTGAHK